MVHTYIVLLLEKTGPTKTLVMKILLITTLLLGVVSPVFLLDSSEASIDNDTTIDYRLPKNSVPISYKINLIPYIVVDNFTFDGESTIELQVLESSSSITLHILALTIDESATSLVSSANVSYKIANHTYDTIKQFLILNFATVLPAGNYTLYLKYVGILDGKIFKGFYRSSYTNDYGETVWLATTQFGATSARKAFPCWDEPALKATFTISIKHDADYTALSNMPVAKKSAIDKSDNKLWTTFERTPIMSTYLVAFVVSDYGYVTNDAGIFKVWSRKNALRATAYALALGESALARLVEYTAFPYILPKMDQISIPDLRTAMENWGLVTYRETYFLYEDDVNTTLMKQDVAGIISHELSHQWFGNLVSPSWWKYIWLNEGFATYFQYYITNEVEDEWRFMEQFVLRAVQDSAFIIDSSETTRPLNQDASTPEEINSLFLDSISYDKGAAVIHMMSNFLTPIGLRAGLIRYLNNHVFGVATSDDLWSALQEVPNENGIPQTGASLKTVMDPWVEQSGFPVITVTRNYSTGTANISQERYFQSGASDDGTRWWVPISYTTQLALNFSSTSPSEWIRQEDDSIVLDGFHSSHWVLFNIRVSGYYRVNYDETNWKLLATYLNSDDYVNIHPVNRAQLVHDSYNLAFANRTSLSTFLNISVYLHREIDYIPWYPMLSADIDLNPRLANTRSHSLYKRFFVERLQKCIVTLGYDMHDDDEHLIKIHRANTLRFACSHGSEECRSNATAKLVAHLADPIANPVSPDLKEWIFCAGLNNANATVWNMVLDLYVKSPSLTTISYLGCSENKEILTTYMTMATAVNSTILKEHAPDAYASVYSGSLENINFALNYLIDNFDKLYKFWDPPTDTMTKYVSEISDLITTRKQLTKLKALIEEHTDVLRSNGSAAIASAESNVKWTDTYEPIFYEWLNNFYRV